MFRNKAEKTGVVRFAVTFAVMFAFMVLLGAGSSAVGQQKYSQVVAKQKLHVTQKGKQRVFARKGEPLMVMSIAGGRITVQSPIGLRARFPQTAFVNQKDAASIYDELIQEEPKDVNLYLLRSQVWAVRGEHKKAIDDCTRALQLDPKQPGVYVNRGVFYASLGEYDRAVSDYGKALKLKVKGEPVYINLAAAYVAKKEYDSAVKVYSRLIQMSPKKADHYVKRGIAHRYRQDWDKAIADFNQALKLDSKNLAAISSRGFVCYLKGDHQKAVVDFNEIIKQQPKNAMAYNNRGFNRQMLGDYKNALIDYDQAIKHDPKYAMAYQNKGWLLATCPDAKFRNGLEAYKAAKKACDMREWKVYSDIKALAAAYAESRDFTHAIEFQTRAVKMTEGDQQTTEQEILKLYKAKQPFRFVLTGAESSPANAASENTQAAKPNDGSPEESKKEPAAASTAKKS